MIFIYIYIYSFLIFYIKNFFGPAALRILVPPKGMESAAPAVEVQRPEPLACQGSPALFHGPLFHYGLPEDTEYHSLRCTAGPCSPIL